MRYVLFSIEDEGLLTRLRDVYINDNNISYLFAKECDEAVRYCDEYEISVAVLSLSMPVMNGDEIAQMISGRNAFAKFVFIYEQSNIEAAVSMFNTYPDCRTIDKNIFNTEDVSKLLNELLSIYKIDDSLTEKIHDQNQKEKAYRNSVGNMLEVLDNRKMANQVIFEMYLLSSRMMFENKEDKALFRVCEFLRNELELYQSIFLFEEYPVTEDFLKSLESRFNCRDEKKYLKLECDFELQSNNRSYILLYIADLICSSFYWFMECYRAKVEIKDKTDCYILNIIYDISYGREDIRAWGYVCSVLKMIGSSLADKFEVGFKEGIMQYRLVIAKALPAAETTNE